MQAYQLILASGSPRRKEFLEWLQLPFTVMASEVAEQSAATNPASMVQELALLKAKDVYAKVAANPASFVLAADTLVFLAEEPLGKPRTLNEAEEMLRKLSGKTHQVLTGVAFVFATAEGRQEHTFFCQTDVSFCVIEEQQLQNYLKTGDSLDKAGAYGIQGPALTFIDQVRGSYSNVVGLPMTDCLQELKKVLKRGLASFI